MIAVDTSARIAIIFAEPERPAFLQAIQQCAKALISTVSVVRDPQADLWPPRPPRGRPRRRSPRAAHFRTCGARKPAMDAATAAFVAYGKGSGHPAALNFGDVFSYALAKVRGLPLLYKGDDFARTDIESAAPANPTSP
jgi:ribonuclease VapC